MQVALQAKFEIEVLKNKMWAEQKSGPNNSQKHLKVPMSREKKKVMYKDYMQNVPYLMTERKHILHR